jgi:hypothetical protein
MALLSFTRRYLIVKDLSGYTGNKRLIPEPFVSCTTDPAEDRCAKLVAAFRPIWGSNLKIVGAAKRCARDRFWSLLVLTSLRKSFTAA